MSALREIIAHFGVKFDSKELEHGHDTIEGTVHKLESLGSLIAGSVIVHGIHQFIEQIVETASSLEHMSVRTGIATDELQELVYAAKSVDISQDSLDSGLTKLGKNLAATGPEAKQTAAAFAKAGVKMHDANGKVRTAADVLPEVADAFAKIENPSERAALAMKFFGKGGAELIPLLAMGAKGIHKLTEEARDLGGGLEEETIEAAGEMEQSAKRLDFAFLGLKSRIAVAVLPILSSLTEKLIHGVIWLQKAAKHTNFFQGLLVALGGAGLGGILKILGGFRGLLSILGKLLLRLALPALLIDELITTFQGGDTIIKRIIDGWFGEGSTQKVVDWFNNLFAEEDEFERHTKETSDQIQATHGEMWAAIYEIFTYGIGSMTHGWDYFIKSLEDSADGWKMFFAATADYMQSAFLSALDSIRAAFVDVWNGVVSGVQSLVDKVRAIPVVGKLLDTDAAKKALEQLKGEETFRKGITFSQALANNANLGNPHIAVPNDLRANAVGVGNGPATYTVEQHIEIHGNADKHTVKEIGRASHQGVKSAHERRNAVDALAQRAPAAG